MTPLLGVLLGISTAVYMDHRRLARGFAVVSFIGVVLAAVALGFFSLDALQTRSQVRPEATGAFDTASAVAAVKYLAGMVVALLLGLGGWSAGRSRGKPGPESGRGVLFSSSPTDREEPEP
jgi:hypothetical protein